MARWGVVWPEERRFFAIEDIRNGRMEPGVAANLRPVAYCGTQPPFRTCAVWSKDHPPRGARPTQFGGCAECLPPLFRIIQNWV
jgi:hypothetical protein